MIYQLANHRKQAKLSRKSHLMLNIVNLPNVAKALRRSCVIFKSWSSFPILFSILNLKIIWTDLQSKSDFKIYVFSALILVSPLFLDAWRSQRHLQKSVFFLLLLGSSLSQKVKLSVVLKANSGSLGLNEHCRCIEGALHMHCRCIEGALQLH